MGRGNKETLDHIPEEPHIHMEEVRLGAKVLLGDKRWHKGVIPPVGAKPR